MLNRDLAEMIDRYRRQDIDIKAVLERVAARGGPTAPWRVNLDAGRATLELMTVCFYLTAGEYGFAPNSYSGFEIETEQDCELLEDAYACIVKAVADQ
jgi:hypothetical protein